MILLISFVIFIFLLQCLVASSFLFLVSNILKIENFSLKKSFFVSLVFNFLGLIFNLIGLYLNIFPISMLITLIILFFIFNFLYKKYYKTSTKKNLGAYALFNGFLLLFSLIVLSPISKNFIPFYIKGNSMSPNINNNDYVLTSKLSRNFSRGEIVTFYKPNSKITLIQRIVGLPGEKIEIKEGDVYINGEVLKEEYYNDKTYGDISLTLGLDEYFILGDNRNATMDSRYFGPINKKDIQGKKILHIKL